MSWKRLILAGTVLMLSSCAVTTIREDGSREVFGFVSMRLDASGTPESYAGDTIDLTTFGILLFNSPLGGGVSLGYARERATALKNHALIVGGPDDFLRSSPSHEAFPAVQPTPDKSTEGNR